MIAERRSEEETVASARSEAAAADRARAQAQDQAQRARAEAEGAQIRADAEHAARERAEADAAEAHERAALAEANAQPVVIQRRVTVVQPVPDTRKSELRMGLLEQLNGVASMRDTARGLVATVPDSAFSGSELHGAVSGQLARLAALVVAHPGLRVDVEGNSDSSASEAMSSQRAETVRRLLITQGLPAGSVTARGLGDTRPFGPNSSAAAREANRRVEIVISGDPIGDMPFWDHRYTLTPGP
jgi:outer membrane protein OmpA-like peptidoglycan-associated protein